MRSLTHRYLALASVLAASLACSPSVAQSVLQDYEKKSFERPEGWAMAHTLSSALNLGAAPARSPGLWQWQLSGEVASIPHLSREEQRVGFGGFKLEDMNKSPVFGRARVHVGLPHDITAEFSYTPPLEIDGARPQQLFGLALERALLQRNDWQLGARLYAVRGDGKGDITCSKRVASYTPGSADNPFGCIAPSRDTLRMDQEGIELMLSRAFQNGRLQPFVAVAGTRMHPYAHVKAQVFTTLDLSELESSGSTTTYTLGASYAATPRWRVSSAFSYTPLDVQRPPQYRTGNGDFWSIRLGLAWTRAPQ